MKDKTMQRGDAETVKRYNQLVKLKNIYRKSQPKPKKSKENAKVDLNGWSIGNSMEFF